MPPRALVRREFLSLAIVAGNSAARAAARSGSTSTPEALQLKDTGTYPNSRYPVLLYRQAMVGGDLAEAFERCLIEQDWEPAWRAGLYGFHHYHSTAHEALGVFRGKASVRLGGPKGTLVELNPGDLLVLPAGVAHKNERHSSDFRVVGAYPVGSSWDMQYGKAGERPDADENIARVPVPRNDPLHGSAGPLRQIWL